MKCGHAECLSALLGLWIFSDQSPLLPEIRSNRPTHIDKDAVARDNTYNRLKACYEVIVLWRMVQMRPQESVSIPKHYVRIADEEAHTSTW